MWCLSKKGTWKLMQRNKEIFKKITGKCLELQISLLSGLNFVEMKAGSFC